MSTICKSSANAMRHPYSRPEFWLNPDNQFWRSALYTQAYRERMQKFVSEMADSRRVLIDLIK